MIERVVVPVDFTAESDRALAVAPALADRAGVGVELVTVAFPASRADVEARLAEAAERVGPGTAWRIVESGGPVVAALLTELHAAEKELWCVGSHARGALGEALVGSRSEQFVRQAHVPVVLVGPHVTDPPMGRVLAVAVDGEDRSEAVVPYAVEIAGALGMTLCLLQVVRPVVDDLVGTDAGETSYLSHVAAHVVGLDPTTVDYDVLHGGHPAHDLVDYATSRHDIGMIALATRGLVGRERLLQGSTAFQVAHRAAVPVAILHQV